MTTTYRCEESDFVAVIDNDMFDLRASLAEIDRRKVGPEEGQIPRKDVKHHTDISWGGHG